MEIIRNSDISRAFEKEKRVYLVGNLKKPNGVKELTHDDYEIGMSEYKDFTFEKPHYHAKSREYNYLLEGSIKLVLLNEKKEYTFTKGDLFVIEVNEPYICKAKAGTRTIFSKVPGGNDKTLVEHLIDQPLLDWGQSFDSPYNPK